MTPSNKPTLVRCTTCANGILPIFDHLMQCALSEYKVHTGKRICPHYIEGVPRDPHTIITNHS